MTLATGLVVDDAIVVIENVARFIQEKGMSPLEGAREAMREITGAVVASSLALLAVFVPVAFFPGTTGQLYKQFALTIVCSITISLFNALTLTPVLSSLLLRQRQKEKGIFRPINRVITGTRARYHSVLPAVVRWRYLVLVLFAVALAGTGIFYTRMPTGFIPDEDQGFMIVSMQTPEGSSLDQTHVVQREVEAILRQQPEVENVFDAGGFGFTGNGSNYATMFIGLKPWAQRRGASHELDAVINRIDGALFFLPDARQSAFAINPPSIPGLGFQGGFNFELEDRAGLGLPALQQAANGIIGATYAPGSAVSNAYTTFRSDKPTVLVDVDRDKALSLGVDLNQIFESMQVYLGSVYVNDFDMNGRTYRVYVEADAPYRAHVSDLNTIYVHSDNPVTTNGVSQTAPEIPLSGLVTIKQVRDPHTIMHFNLYRAIEIDGGTPPGVGTGASIAQMQRLANQIAPNFGYEWSGISREEIEGGSQALLIFALGIVFVFLVLSAQYESFVDPLIILFAVPLALLGAIGGLWLRHMTSDVFAQVGYVMLIGLAAKNAILIVEFANQLREQGVDAMTAVIRAAETRFRPIVMTSIAFILGVTPLVFASGAGANARHSLGTVVFFGMLVSTVLNLFVTPVLYVLIAAIEDRLGIGHGRKGHSGDDDLVDPTRPQQTANI
jgi:HAE1 family hydrophobic/amphiphilic exporter-1